MRTRRTLAVLALTALALLPASTTLAFTPSYPHSPRQWCVASGDSHLQMLTLQLMSTLLPNSILVVDDLGIIASQFTPAAVVAIDLKTGEERWRVPTTQGRVFIATTPVEGAIISAASELGRVTIASLDLLTGEVNWSVLVSGGMATPPVVSSSGIFADLGDAGIIAIGARTGEIRWQRKSDVRNGPLVLAGERSLISGLQDGQVVALDIETGEEIWSNSVAGASGWAWSGASDEENVVLTAWTGNPAMTGVAVIGFAIDTGIERWRFPLAGEFATGPTFVRGAVIVATGGGVVYALDSRTGVTLWEWQGHESETRETYRGPIPFANDDLILVSGIRSIDETISGVIHAIARTTGREQWRITSTGLFDTPAILADHQVIAGDLGTAGIASVCAYPVPTLNFPGFPTGPST